MSWFISSSFVECKLFEIRTLSFSYCIPTSITISSTKEVLDKLVEREKSYSEGQICLMSNPNFVSCQLLEGEAFLFNLLSFSLHVLKCV